MENPVIRILAFLIFLAFLFSACILRIASAAREEILMGTVIQQGKRFIIEAEDGDYIVKGKDVSKMAGKLVEATGVIVESNKEDTIEVIAIQDIQDTQPE